MSSTMENVRCSIVSLEGNIFSGIGWLVGSLRAMAHCGVCLLPLSDTHSGRSRSAHAYALGLLVSHTDDGQDVEHDHAAPVAVEVPPADQVMRTPPHKAKPSLASSSRKKLVEIGNTAACGGTTTTTTPSRV